MMGLLDMYDDPKTMGLLSLGLRLMSTPGKFGTALGTAGMGAMGDMQAALQAGEQKKQRELQRKADEQRMAMQALQMQQIQAQMQQQKVRAGAAQRAFVPGAPGMVDTAPGSDGLNMPASEGRFDLSKYMQELALGGDAETAMDVYARMQKENPTHVLSPGAILTRDGKTLASNPLQEKPEKPDPNKPFLIIDGKVVPNLDYQNYELRKAGAGASRGGPAREKWQYDAARGGRVNLDTGEFQPALQDGKPIGPRSEVGPELPLKEKQKREAVYPAATKAIEAFDATSDELKRDLETLKKHPGLSSITGIAAGRLPGITDAGRAAQALYDKIQARGGFQELQGLKAAGSTLGQVSNAEGQNLRSAFSAIDRRQEAADVRRAIDDAIAKTEIARKNMRDAYDATYEYRQSPTTPGGRPPLSAFGGG